MMEMTQTLHWCQSTGPVHSSTYIGIGMGDSQKPDSEDTEKNGFLAKGNGEDPNAWQGYHEDDETCHEVYNGSKLTDRQSVETPRLRAGRENRDWDTRHSENHVLHRRPDDHEAQRPHTHPAQVRVREDSTILK